MFRPLLAAWREGSVLKAFVHGFTVFELGAVLVSGLDAPPLIRLELYPFEVLVS